MVRLHSKEEIMSYIDNFIEDFPPCYDTAEGDAEQAAHHQKQFDGAWLLANQYDMRIDHARLLCDMAGISFEEFCKYNGGTK